MRMLLALLLLMPPAVQADDLVARLRAIPGMTVVADNGPPAGYQKFLSLTYRQPVDHRQPDRATFQQRFTLLHKADAQPMVLHTSGYDVYFDRPFRSELTFLLQANQIAVEQRYFAPSRPEPADWSKLDVWQAASDHHRLVTALKPLFQNRWLETGESKGGMTAVYHRRFYPDDVDATVAYVAPNDVKDDEDAYEEFLDEVGTDAACRTKLVDLQKESLKRRGELIARYEDWAAKNQRTFTASAGSAEHAFEMLVVEMPFVFWQYGRQYHCRSLPSTSASTDELYRWLDRTANWNAYTDQGIARVLPYYYQAGTQLGYPQFPERGLDLRFTGQFAARHFVPRAIPMTYQPGVMADIDAWVRTRSERMMFVYGQNDPWSAEAFHPSGNDSFSYTVAAGNHNVDIRDLAAAQRSAAESTIRRWAGVTSTETTYVPGLDDWRPARSPR